MRIRICGGHWKQPNGETLLSAAIIVTEANPDTRQIHDRMPVILPREVWDSWLDPENHDTEALQGLLKPAPKGSLVSGPASSLVNSPKNNSPELIGDN